MLAAGGTRSNVQRALNTLISKVLAVEEDGEYRLTPDGSVALGRSVD